MPAWAGSSVGIATGYGLDGPGIESRWGAKYFCTCPDRPWGPPNLLYNWYRVIPGGKDRPGRDADPSTPSGAVGYERVELYLYSPYGPYGLYRASVHVQGCTVPLPAVWLSLVWYSRNPRTLNCIKIRQGFWLLRRSYRQVGRTNGHGLQIRLLLLPTESLIFLAHQ